MFLKQNTVTFVFKQQVLFRVDIQSEPCDLKAQCPMLKLDVKI